MSYYCEKCKQQREQGCFGPRCPGIPKHANTDALPPPDRTMWQYGKQIDHYTAEQMRAAIATERARWTEAVMAELDGNGQAHAIVAYATRA